MSLSKAITLTCPRCEYADEPLGLDTTTPRFSWMVQHPARGEGQSAYRILVASDPELLAREIGDLWDSGKVPDGNGVGIRYGGRPLRSRQQCWWKARVWDRDDRVSEYSAVRRFGVGLLAEGDWQARWIASPHPRRGVAPFFRTTFGVDKPVARALLYICGLGYYELHVNGAKVGDHVLDPGWTDYNRRVLYVSYDVTEHLRPGANALGAILGEGWYGNEHSSIGLHGPRPELPWLGWPCLIAQLHITFADGGEVRLGGSGDAGWWVSEGPIVENNVYDGERYDARREMPGWDRPEYRPEEHAGWVRAAVVEGPKGRLAPQLLEPIKVVRDLSPVSIHSPRPGIHVADLGQNFAGWVRLTVEGPAGAEVTMRYAEVLGEDGLVSQATLRGARATDRYLLRGGGVEVYEPRFSYHGFRYVQIEGFPGDFGPGNVVGRVVRSAVKQTGSFACSNELLNAIQHNVLWTEGSNLHSLPTDCPQRDERMGWLNDMTVRAEEAVYNFDLVRLLSKWEDDIADTQGEDGAITDTAPFVWGNRPADPVSTCFLLIPWLLYTRFGDRRTLERHYADVKRWNEYLGSRAEDDIVMYSHWGDWAPPAGERAPGTARSAHTPGEFISTGYYYYNARLLAEFARILGEESDAAHFAQLAERIKLAFNGRFLDPATGRYAQGNQAAQAFALFLGVAPEEVRPAAVERLVEAVAGRDYHLTTGNLCTKYLLEALTEHGQVEAAYRLATQTSYPSWGYEVGHGATTIWEIWEYETGGGMNSHNHPMYGTIGSWCYKYLAGIRFDPAYPACGRVVIKPYFPAELTFVKASVHTVQGEVGSHWERIGKGLCLRVVIPGNCTGTVSVPVGEGGTVREGDVVIWRGGAPGAPAPGVTACRLCGDRVEVSVGSGRYGFVTE